MFTNRYRGEINGSLADYFTGTLLVFDGTSGTLCATKGRVEILLTFENGVFAERPKKITLGVLGHTPIGFIGFSRV